MGREIRKVPATWKHPKNVRGQYIPLFGRSFAAELAQWDLGAQKWTEGLYDDFHGGWKPIDDKYKGDSYAEYAGDRPRIENYMPDWPESERTHMQMYETTSEGTPISGVHATEEDVARDLADNGASWFANQTMSYEAWLDFIRGRRHDAGVLVMIVPA